MLLHPVFVNHRRRLQLFSLFAAVGGGLSIALFVLLMGHTAQAAPVSPTVPGSIAGTVTASNGAALAGIEVHLIRDGDSYPTRRTSTDGNGNYRFAVLAPGVYRVEFVDPEGIYAFQFYPNATTLAAATVLFIAGDNRASIDTQLPIGGVITGVITGTDGIVLDQSQHTLYRLINPGEWQEWERTAFTTTAGAFRYGGLATGRYQLCALGNAFGAGSFVECYDDGYYNTATEIAVTAGMTTSNIDILLGNHVLNTQVKGRVTDEAGQPLAQIEIQSYAPDSPNIQGSSLSDAQGNYRLNFMQGGLYILRIVDPAGIYAPEYYNNVQQRADATVFRLRDDSFVEGINISLTLAARITGTVLINNQVPPDRGTVFAVHQVGDVWQLAAQANIDPQTGYYDLRGLSTDTYYLTARGALGQDEFQSAPNFEQGRPVAVTVGERKQQVDFSLGEGAYEGRIAGSVRAAGLPIAGIKVELYRRFEYPLFNQQPVYYLYSDSNGNYSFNNLLTAEYFIRFADPAGHYAANYYPNQLTPGTAATLAVSNTVALLDVSTTLAPAGFISGRVTRKDGTPIAGATVTPYLDLEYSWFALRAHSATSDAQGNYRLTGLAAGSYLLHFAGGLPYSGPDGSVYEPNKFYGGTYDPNTAVPVPVSAGQTTANINIILGPVTIAHLPIVNR